jgi:hypothetical protein
MIVDIEEKNKLTKYITKKRYVNKKATISDNKVGIS